jgi:hypothetical protein
MSELTVFYYDRSKMTPDEINALWAVMKPLMADGKCIKMTHLSVENTGADKPKKKKAKSSQEPTPLMKHLAKRLYNRRESTFWNEQEVEAYNDIKARYEDESTLKSDVELLGRYYDEQRKKPEEENYAKRDLITCLNNFTSQVERAVNYRFPANKRVQLEMDDEPKGWQDYMEKKLGHGDFDHDWGRVSKPMRLEIIREMENEG